MHIAGIASDEYQGLNEFCITAMVWCEGCRICKSWSEMQNLYFKNYPLLPLHDCEFIHCEAREIMYLVASVCPALHLSRPSGCLSSFSWVNRFRGSITPILLDCIIIPLQRTKINKIIEVCSHLFNLSGECGRMRIIARMRSFHNGLVYDLYMEHKQTSNSLLLQCSN